MGIAISSRIKAALLGLVLAGCTGSNTGPVQSATVLTPSCPLPPPTFDASDLVGTWTASYSGGAATDTLVVRDDGTYKQTYDDPLAGIHFQTDWLPWWSEPRKSGYVRVHFVGMHRCDGTLSTCSRDGGGTTQRTIDYCEQVDVDIPDEVLLIVTGPPRGQHVPRDNIHRHSRLSGSEWSYSFELKE